MSGEFRYVSDVGRGEWLRPLEDEAFSSFLSIVPRGYEMYARVLHPVVRDRPRATKTWHGLDETTFFGNASDFDAEIESQRSTWSEAASAFNTTIHPEAQYARLLRSEPGEVHSAVGHDGWRYRVPAEGHLEASALATVTAVLARHTATPDAGIAAIWEGWGGLVSSAGSRLVMVQMADDSPDDDHGARGAWRATARSIQRLRADLHRFRWKALRSIQSRLPTPAWKVPKPGSGVLDVEIATGPRLDLHGGTGRQYLLFEAGAEDFRDPSWTARAPWTNHAAWAQSPSILWPEDHSWVLATEIDYDSTLIAGTRELIGELMKTPDLEVFPIGTDADLTWNGDALNRPR